MSNPTVSESQETKTILIVDDEPTICWAFEKLFAGEGHNVLIASSAEEGLETAASNQPDLILLDVRLPKEDGLSALPKFLECTAQAPVIVMTAFGDLETAVSAVAKGATDYITKPFDLDQVHSISHQALEAGKGRRDAETTGALERSNKLVGVSPAMQSVFKQIAFVANSDLAVLITGQTGTGKELVAEAIHRHSHRRDAPYLCIAPVTLNEDLIESELFGHVEGAFTGANRDRTGVFESAEKGTVLLDEIGDLPLSIQVKLLRVLEVGEFSRVGETRTRTCNVRILAATNRDLEQSVADGSFREDLFYRLNGLQMHLPPLNSRLEDIAPLCRHFLQQMKYPILDLGEELLAALQSRTWQGNIRQLRSAVQQAAVVARGQPLTLAHFPSEPVETSISAQEATYAAADLQSQIVAWFHQRLTQLEQASPEEAKGLYQDFLAAAEPILFRLAMEQTAGNRSKAADLLGIHRATLREKLKTQPSSEQD